MGARKEKLVWFFILVAIIAAGVLLGQVRKALAFSEVPPGDMTCAEVTGADDDNSLTNDAPYPNDRFIYIRCEFPPHISKYVRADTNYPQYSVILIPRYPTKKLGWSLKFDGHNARPVDCNTWPDADYNAFVMRFCPEHYPNDALYPGKGSSWGGPVDGQNPLGWRIAATMKYVNDNYGHLLDKSAGAKLFGCSWGGSTSILQSMLIPDPWARALVNKVDACVPPTLLVKQTPPVGQYWVPGTGVAATWGAFDWTLADFRVHADPYKYHRLVGSPADTAVVFDVAILDVCEEKKLACFAMWHNAGHNPLEVGVNLPFFSLYSGPDSDVRLDKPLIAFTGSTANFLGELRGHYNLGLEWDSAGSYSAGSVVGIPIRYRARSGIGGDIPPQPEQATFNVTLRRVPYRPGDTVYWDLGSQKGAATVASGGAVTIEGLTLASSTAYTALRVWK